MKKKYLSLIALFILITTQAQTVTEADLLGEWQISKIYIEGSIYDFEKGEATYSEKSIARINAEGRDTDSDKAEILNKMGSLQFIFKPDFKADFGPKDRLKEHNYTLTEREGATYLKMGEKSEMKIAITKGYFRLTIPSLNDEVNVMEYRKKE